MTETLASYLHEAEYCIRTEYAPNGLLFLTLPLLNFSLSLNQKSNAHIISENQAKVNIVTNINNAFVI